MPHETDVPTRRALLAKTLLMLAGTVPVRALTNWPMLSGCQLAQRRGELAVAQVEAALKKTPDDLRLRFALGVMTMELGQQARARRAFQALTQEHSDLADPTTTWRCCRLRPVI